MQELQLYNTLTRQLEPFQPIEPGKIKMYVCGPTVYDVPHLGHARCYLTWDVLYRFLKFLDYDVTYARNITDVDDKILERAAKNQQTPESLTAHFTQVFEDNMATLNLLTPNIQPRATTHAESMIAFIQTLIDKGFAYTTPDGDVYYDTSKKSDYGKLCQQSLDDLRSGARVQVDTNKKNPLDFVLWKSADASGALTWKTPWGVGRPGWHIECSTMILDVLGEQIDIHAGGYDLVFPHHENEVAQSEARTGKQPFAKYWLHNGFVNVSGEKMSKSLGNFATLADILNDYDADTIRYFVLTNHYRVPVDFNSEAMAGAKNRVEKIKQKVAELLAKLTCTRDELIQAAQPTVKAALGLKNTQPDDERGKLICDWYSGMLNDLNTAQALASINGLLSIAAKAQNNEATEQTLGLFLCLSDAMGFVFDASDNAARSDQYLDTIVAQLEALWHSLDSNASSTQSGKMAIDGILAARQTARNNKDWATSDRVRDALLDLGIQILDKKDGPTEWVKKQI